MIKKWVNLLCCFFKKEASSITSGAISQGQTERQRIESSSLAVALSVCKCVWVSVWV